MIDAADGVRGQLVDHAGSRRADFDAVEQIARGDAAFDQFGFLALGLAEILDDVGAKILIDTDDLKLGLADLRFGLGDGGDQLAAFAVEPRSLALQRGEARQRHQPLVVEILDAGEFALDQFQLLAPWNPTCTLSPEISSVSWATWLCSRSFWLWRALERALNSDSSDASRLFIVSSFARPASSGGNLDLRKVVAFGGEPRDLGAELVELLGHHLQARLRLRRIEPDQEVAGDDPRAVLTLISATTPPVGCWIGLHVGLDDEIAGHDDGARQRHEEEPAAAEHACDQDQNAKPGAQFVLERPAGPQRSGCSSAGGRAAASLPCTTKLTPAIRPVRQRLIGLATARFGLRRRRRDAAQALWSGDGHRLDAVRGFGRGFARSIGQGIVAARMVGLRAARRRGVGFAVAYRRLTSRQARGAFEA